jgi:hypothetical protein
MLRNTAIPVRIWTDCLPFRHKFVKNHAIFAKKCDQPDFDLGLLQMKLFGAIGDFEVQYKL